MLKAIGEDAPEELQLRLWTRLADISSEHLGDSEAAMTAYEVAVSLDPTEMSRREQLVNLYLEAGEPDVPDLRFGVGHPCELDDGCSGVDRWCGSAR